MPGYLTISIEVELMWGYIDKLEKGRRFIGRTRATHRKYLKKLLEACEKTGVQISFDVVGHLGLDSCSGHPHSPASPEWFANDPGPKAGKDSPFYAPEFYDLIRSSTINHEICTHTFSHIDCSEASRALLDWELSEVKKVHRRYNLPQPTSLVPPRHAPPQSYQALRDNGIEVVRVAKPSAVAPPSSTLMKLPWFFWRDQVFGPPRKVDGLMETYVTPYPSLTAKTLPIGEKDPHPIFRTVPKSVRQKIHTCHLINTLNTTISRGTHLHLWTHLYNLSNPDQLSCIEKFLNRVQEKTNQKNALRVKTMENLGKHSPSEVVQ